ncbi:MAG: dihydrodipicolinate synthase family protein [Verrucomicrobiota bacterium]
MEKYFREIAAKSPIDIIVYNIPVFANEISIPVLKRLALDCPRIVGTKDTSKDMCRFQQTLLEIKPLRPDFAVLIGWEELLCAGMFVGADGGTLASGGIVPEVVMKIYGDCRAGKWDAAKQTQFKLIELFSLMVGPRIFQKVSGQVTSCGAFTPVMRAFPLSDHEAVILAEMRGKLACVLADCGFAEAASECRRVDGHCPAPAALKGLDVESVVRSVLNVLNK